MAMKLPRVLASMDPKRRQYLYLALAVLVVLAVYLFVNSLLGSPRAPDPEAAVATATKANTKVLSHPPGQQISDRENWIGGAARDLETVKRQAQEASRRQDQMNREVLARLQQIENNSKTAAARPAIPEPPAPVPVPVAPLPPPQAYPPRPGSYPPGSPNSQYRAPQAGVDAQASGAPVSVGMIRVTLRSTADAAPGNNGGNSGSGPVDPKKEIPRVSNNLPVSFVRATMLSGVDAPTGGTANKNPLPVLLRLDDLAVLPNGFRSDIKECFAIGEATGSMSAERAYIRVIRLSCVSFRGEILEVDAIGAVHGPDGKVGVRGRLVQKQGAILGKALLAGIASGIGQGFAQQNTTYSVSPLGAVSTVDPSKILQSGLYNGVAIAMNQLAKFYIDSAAAIYPIIEVDAATPVDIVITQRVSFAAALPSSGPDSAMPTRTIDRAPLVRQVNSLSEQEE